MAPALPLPLPKYLIATRETVVRVELGLTAYLGEPRLWATEGAARMLRWFLARAGAESATWYTTSLQTNWRRRRPEDRDVLVESLSARGPLQARLRHHFSFRLADDPGAPGTGLSYTEVDPARATRAAVLELTFPAEADPVLLAEAAHELGRTGPVHAAVGGFAARWNPRHRRLAFDQLHRWCRRYLAVDVQVPDEMAWEAPAALPGVGWLTLIGHDVAKLRRLDLRGLATRRWEAGVTATPLPAGLLLQAGAAPALGDVNALEWPAAQAAVAAALADHLVDRPAQFWGEFWGRQDTGLWFRRLVAPQRWE